MSTFSFGDQQQNTQAPFGGFSFGNTQSNPSALNLTSQANPTFGATPFGTTGTTTSSVFGTTQTAPAFSTSLFPSSTTTTSSFPTLGQSSSATPGVFSLGGGFANPVSTTSTFNAVNPLVPASSSISTTTATVGLGGVDVQTSTGLSGGNASTKKDGKAVKESQIPNEIAVLVESFKKYVKEQKAIREEMSRISSNMNLHRKLLSTSSDRTGVYFEKASSIYPFHTDSYNRDLFSRFHEQSSLPLTAMEYYSRIPHDGAGAPFLSPFAHLPGAISNYHPAFFSPSTYTTFKNDSSVRFSHRPDENSGQNSSLSSISNPSSPGPSSGDSPKESLSHSNTVKLDEDLTPDNDGRFICSICEKKFHEGVVLREHYEKSHTEELHHCFTNGCNKVFLSKQARKTHSDNWHKEKTVDDT